MYFSHPFHSFLISIFTKSKLKQILVIAMTAKKLNHIFLPSILKRLLFSSYFKQLNPHPGYYITLFVPCNKFGPCNVSFLAIFNL